MALSPLARLQAAVLACGPKAVVSHASAAFLWGLRESLPATIDITLVGRQLRPKRGIRLHRVTSVDHRDLRRRDGLPVTSPARMAIDLAPQLDLDQLDELIAEARVKRLIRPGELEAAMQRAGPCSGRARTRRALAAEGDPGLTRSRAERMLRRLLREGRLPEPRTNVRLGPYEVDFLWEEQRLIVEFDSWRFHGHRRAFENDRSKDVALTNAGYEVLRFTWRQLETEPLVVLAAIARALGQRELAVV